MKIAIYGRVSTSDQNPENQLKLLREYANRRGAEEVIEYVDRGISGAKANRPALNQLMADARLFHFNVVVVWKFDRFARSLKMLLESLEEFRHLKIDFISLTENIDTGSPIGQFFFSICGAFAQFERDLIRERIKVGIARAKAEGVAMGRKPKKQYDFSSAWRMIDNEKLSLRQISQKLKIPLSTLAKRNQKRKHETAG